jgi:hypothetical protein
VRVEEGTAFVTNPMAIRAVVAVLECPVLLLMRSSRGRRRNESRGRGDNRGNRLRRENRWQTLSLVHHKSGHVDQAHNNLTSIAVFGYNKVLTCVNNFSHLQRRK